MTESSIWLSETVKRSVLCLSVVPESGIVIGMIVGPIIIAVISIILTVVLCRRCRYEGSMYTRCRPAWILRARKVFFITHQLNSTAVRELEITCFPVGVFTEHKHTERQPFYSVSRKTCLKNKIGIGSPYSITEHMATELIPVLVSQSVINPAVGRQYFPPGPQLPLQPLSFAAWWTEAQWVWTVCVRLLVESVATAIWTRALLRLSPAR